MKIHVAMIADRHSDPEPELFTYLENAIQYVRKWAQENASRPEDFEEPTVPEDWLYYATYSTEGDSVWVLEKELDGEIYKAIESSKRI